MHEPARPTVKSFRFAILTIVWACTGTPLSAHASPVWYLIDLQPGRELCKRLDDTLDPVTSLADYFGSRQMRVIYNIKHPDGHRWLSIEVEVEKGKKLPFSYATSEFQCKAFKAEWDRISQDDERRARHIAREVKRLMPSRSGAADSGSDSSPTRSSSTTRETRVVASTTATGYSKESFRLFALGKSKDEILATLGRPADTKEQNYDKRHFWYYPNTRLKVMDTITGKLVSETTLTFSQVSNRVVSVDY
jgi:hypothetical protein